MQRARRVAVVLATVGLVDVACGGSGDVASAGDCFAAGTVEAFAWDAGVDCDEPHTVEVFASLPVTGELAGYQRSELDLEGSRARALYLAQVVQECEPAWSVYTGYAELAASVADATVLPALYGDMAIEATPAEAWDAGDRRLVCYQVFGRSGEPAITVDNQVLAELADNPEQAPLQVRDCARSPTADQGERRVGCAEPHDREYLGYVDLTEFAGIVPGLDLAFLQSFDSRTAVEPQWAVIDQVCSRVFPALIGGPRPDVSLLGQVFTEDVDAGWGDGGQYHAACVAQTGRQVTGSLIGLGTDPLPIAD